MKSGIYVIRCSVNNKVYVGSALDFDKRWNVHRSVLRRAKHHSPLLQRAWSKYGEAAFTFEKVELVEPENVKLLEREQEWFTRLNVLDRKYGFNVCGIAGTRRGCKVPREIVERKAAMQRGRKLPPRSEELKERVRRQRLGSHHTDETREKMSISQSKRVHTKEQHAKIGAKVRHGTCAQAKTDRYVLVATNSNASELRPRGSGVERLTACTACLSGYGSPETS